MRLSWLGCFPSGIPVPPMERVQAQAQYLGRGKSSKRLVMPSRTSDGQLARCELAMDSGILLVRLGWVRGARARRRNMPQPVFLWR